MSGGWDVHTHLVPEQVARWAAAGEWGLSLDDGKLVNGSARVPMGRLFEPGRLVEWVESEELAGAVVSVPPPLFEIAGPDPKMQYLWARALNLALAEACSVDSDRLKPLALLPLADAEESLAFLRGHDFGPQGFVGAVIGTDSAQVPLSSSSLAPVWEAIATEPISVFIHPSSCPDPRLTDFYLTNLLGNPVETAISVAHLIFGRVMERFEPTIVLAHGGGVSPVVVGRWEQGFLSRRPGIPELARSPRETLQQFFVDGLVYDSATLEFVIQQFGMSRVLLGSDWPFPIAATSRAIALPGLRDPAIAQIADNAVRAFPQLT